MTDINTIATLATRLDKKPNKQVVWELLEKEVFPIEGLGVETKAVLYRFFMPAPPAKAKTLHHWVAKAVSKEGTRPYLNHVYFDGMFLVATDGHRLHYSKPDDLGAYEKECFYDAAGNKVNGDGFTFPQWQRVVPEAGESVRLTVSDLRVVQVESKDKGAPANAYVLPNDTYVNIKYLDEALNGHKEFTVLNADSDHKTPVLITTPDNRRSVVMPIRH